MSEIVYSDDNDIDDDDNTEANSTSGSGIDKEITINENQTENTVSQPSLLSNSLKNKNEREKINICKLKAWKLFDKYIRIGSEFEVNVSYEDRKLLIDKMQNKQQWLNNDNDCANGIELFVLFDDICKENVRLLMFLAVRMIGRETKKQKLLLALNIKQHVDG